MITQIKMEEKMYKFIHSPLENLALKGEVEGGSVSTHNKPQSLDRGSHKLIFLAFILLFLPFRGYAEDKPPVPDPRQRIEEIRKQELDHLKKNDPQEYERRKQFYAQQEEKSNIVDSLNKGKITLSEAERRLYPIIKEEVKGEISSLDQRIAILEKELNSLKKAKADPNYLIKSRINQILGKGQDSSM